MSPPTQHEIAFTSPINPVSPNDCTMCDTFPRYTALTGTLIYCVIKHEFILVYLTGALKLDFYPGTCSRQANRIMPVDIIFH